MFNLAPERGITTGVSGFYTSSRAFLTEKPKPNPVTSNTQKTTALPRPGTA